MKRKIAKYAKITILLIFIVSIVIFLRWCTTLPVGGYCVKDCSTSHYNSETGAISNCMPPVCYDSEGDVKENGR